ncbi:MAG: alpha/beta fold hydrolase [Caldilineales bacterium]|nr:alpha/beta fold hydrolase [Caldilineales bacterium]
MKTQNVHLCVLAVVLLATMFLAACGAPAAATSVPPASRPPTPTPNPVPMETVRVSSAGFPGEGFMEIGEFSSEALANNLIGDTTTRRYYVYLPPGYDDTSKRYPVVYMMHYFSGRAGDWFNTFAEKLDDMIASGEAPEMIMVAPDGYNKFGGSMFMSSPTIGDYETYVTQEFVDRIDASYRTLPSNESRGITGCGMGGDSAAHLAFKYPDVFGTLASISGFYDYENNEWLQKETETIKALPEDFSDSGMSTMAGWYLAGAAIAAPNPDKPPFYLDMPFAIEDGKVEIIPEVWDKFIALDPMHEARTYQENLKELNAILIYHGNHDPEVSAEIAQGFSSLLVELGAEQDYLEVGGGHCDMDLEPVVRFFADNLVHEASEAEPVAEIPELISGFVDNDGVKIHYEVVGEGPPLVLVHWGSGSTKDWHIFGYVDALKDDYQLILIDMRGHGQSDKPHDPSAYDAETQVGDVLAVLDELGIEKANYFGYSLGANLGWALAKHAPDRFHSYILGGDAPSSWDDSEWAAWMLDTGAEGWARIIEDATREIGVWSPEINAAYAADDLEAVALNSKALNAEDYFVDLPDMQTPILLLVGTEDEEYWGMVYAEQSLPNATMAKMQDLNHAVGFMLSDQALPYITEFLAEVSAEEQAPASGMDDATVAKIEALVEKTMMNNYLPGLAIGIVKDGEVVYAEGFGVGNVEEENPVTTQSLFNVGHVTNLFTAAAVMQLVEQGLVDLDAPVTDYLPYFSLDDPRFTDIIVRQLLAHTSGLPGVGIEVDAEWKRMGHDNPDNEEGALERLVRGLDDVTLLADPGGTETMFSNISYDTLGDIIAKVSGQSYEDYMTANILEPLGMDQSTFILDDADAALLTTAYQRDAATNELSEWGFFPSNMQHNPAIGLISNVDDMTKWAAALLNGGELNGVRILQADTVAEMWSPTSHMGWGGIFQDFGTGWAVADVDGHRLGWMVGDVPGQISNIALAPDEDIAVVTMVNSFRFMGDDEPWYATDIGVAAVHELLGLDFEGIWTD